MRNNSSLLIALLEVIAYATYSGSEVESVSFENVPSFVYKKDVPIKIDDYEFQVDIAFGGAFMQ